MNDLRDLLTPEQWLAHVRRYPEDLSFVSALSAAWEVSVEDLLALLP